MGDVVRGVEGGRDGVKEGATPLAAMVVECAGQIVGVAIIRREEVSLSLSHSLSLYLYISLSLSLSLVCVCVHDVCVQSPP